MDWELLFAQSQINGLVNYEWAVGTKPGMENVQAFTRDGIVFGNKVKESGPGKIKHHIVS